MDKICLNSICPNPTSISINSRNNHEDPLTDYLGELQLVWTRLHHPSLTQQAAREHWSWPQKIDRVRIQGLMRMDFIESNTNVIFLGVVGVGKTHIAAQAAPRLKQELKKNLLILDELGYLPIDKQGADLLFQIISGRYERGSILLTTNKSFKQWATNFNNDNTLASAVLDRLLHHAQIIVIEGPSYRMKDQVNPQ